MSDVYKVGVQIAMTSNGAQVLGALGKSILGVGLSAKELEGGLSRAKLAAIGLGGVLAGSAVIGGMVKLVEHGKEFVHQQSLMRQAGVSQVDVANATAAAWRTAGTVIGTSAEKNIELVADLRNRLGSMKEAIQALPEISKVGVVLQNLTGQDQAKTGDAVARFLELRGSLVDPVTHQISTARLEQQARLVEAIAIGTRGKVGPDQLLAFQTYARAAGANLTDQGLMNIAPIIGASRNPSTVGTQLASLQQQILGGVTTQAGAKFLEQLGVLNSKKVHIGRGGHMTFDRDALNDSQLAATDPVTYINKYIRAGLIKDGATTADAQTTELMRSHLRATVIGLLTEVVRSFPAFQKDTANIAQAAGTDSFAVAKATDPTTKLADFETSWKNLLTALGSPLVNDATGMLGGLTSGLTMMTTMAARHPRLVEDIEMLAGGLAAMAAVSGAAAIAGAALGPLATAITVLKGAGAAKAGADLASVSTGLGLLAKTLPLALAALAGYEAGKWLRENTPIGAAIDNAVDDIKNRLRDGPETGGLYKKFHDWWYREQAREHPLPEVADGPRQRARLRQLVPLLPQPEDSPYRVMPTLPQATYQKEAYETGAGGSARPVINVYLDSDPIAHRVEIRQSQRAARPSAYGNAPDPMEVVPRPGMPVVAL